MKNETKGRKERMEAIIKLRELVEEGDTIYGVLRYTSRDGMNRTVSLYLIKENEPIKIDWLAADLLEGYDSRHDGCKVAGAGTDACWLLVTRLSYLLYGNGYKLKSRWL